MADVQDLFVERIVDGHYEFEGSLRPLTVHREEIRVRGRREPHVLEVQETHHGPIVTGPLGAEGDEPLALAWTGLREPFFTSLGVDVGAMETGEEAVERFEEYSVPVMNMVWADTGGNIGYKLVGKLPLRRGDCPDLPKPGWTGEHEWDGYVPYDELPAVVNPPERDDRDRQQPRRAGRLPPPHHERVPRRLPGGADRAAAGREGAPLARRLRPHPERPLLDPRGGDRAAAARPGAAPTPARPSVPARLGPPARPRAARRRPSTRRSSSTSRALVSEAAIGDPGYAERWRSKSLLGFTAMTSSPWRFHAHLLELWEEADPELVGGRAWDELAREALRAAVDELDRERRDRRWGAVHGLRFPHALGEGSRPGSRACSTASCRGGFRAGGGQETVSQIGFVAHEGDYTGIVGAVVPAARRRRRAGAHALAAHDRAVGAPGSPHYDDLLEDWLAGGTNPVREPPVASLRLEPS